MKRKIVTLLLVLSIATISITACGNKTATNTDTVESSTEISQETDATSEESTVALLPWLQLSSLESHPELRAKVDEYFGVTGTVGNKEGGMYTNSLLNKTNQNTTLYLVMTDYNFLQNFLLEKPMTDLGNMALEHYADVEVDDLSSAYATINAYFELLPDAEAGVFDGTASISRAQAMALVMRATTPVNESQAPEVDAEFTTAVGESQYTDFAAPMNDYAYINTSNGLNEKTFDGTMTRGEYISLLMNLIFKDYEGEIPETELTVLKDAGNITLAEAISDASNGAPSDMYTTLKNAVALGIVDEDSLEWDSVLTKADAVQLFIEANAVHNGLVGYFILPSEAYKPGYTVNEDGSYSYDGSKDTSDSYDKEIWEAGQWIRNEAWKMAGCESASEFVDTYAPGLGYREAWRAYALQNGADDVVGECWVYYHGKAAGNEPSYAINKMTGEKIVSGPHAMLPGGLNFWGCGAEYEANFDAYLNSL